MSQAKCEPFKKRSSWWGINRTFYTIHIFKIIVCLYFIKPQFFLIVDTYILT